MSKGKKKKKIPVLIGYGTSVIQPNLAYKQKTETLKGMRHCKG